MITLNNLSKYFNRHKKNELHVINNTSLEFGDTGLVALLGPSGSGKTTLLNCIGGLDKVNSGTIIIDGKKITRKNFRKMDKIRNLNIGYVFQDYKLIDDWTVFENVAVALKMCGVKDKKEIKKRVDKVLDVLELYRYRKRPASMLSGGERQRVGIARAIVKNPSIIICDEPTGNLDSRNSIEIMNIIKAISREKLVILVTHEVELANLYASRIITLEDGKIINDAENNETHEIDYGNEGKIFLKDMSIHEVFNNDDIDINFYSEKNKKMKINLVYKNNTLYIETNNNVEIINEDSAFELINTHYKKMDKSVYEKYQFENEEIKGKKYSSLYNLLSMLSVGLKKIKGYSFVRKLSLLSFLLAGIMIMYSLSSIAGVSKVHLEDFNFDDNTYLKVTSNDGVSLEKSLEKISNVNYLVPSGMQFEFNIPVDDIFQTQGFNQPLTASLGSASLLNDKDLIMGRLPKSGEVVIDRRVFDKVSEEGFMSNNLLLVGIDKLEELLNRKLAINDRKYYTIVGITDKNISEVFVNQDDLLETIAYANNYEIFERDTFRLVDSVDNLTLTKGRMPNNGEVIINENLHELYPLNNNSKIKLGSKELAVVGYYRSDEVEYYLINKDTLKYHMYENSTDYIISSSDKKKTIKDLKNAGIMAEDLYERNYKEYENSRKESVNSTIVATSVIFVITLFEIFFVIRASFQSRIKEVGTMRAIGVKRSDIYRMFAGEIIVSTTLAGLSGILLCYGFIYSLSDISIISRILSVNPLLVILAALILYLFNLVIGLLPVWLTVRSTPAAILSRKDI